MRASGCAGGTGLTGGDRMAARGGGPAVDRARRPQARTVRAWPPLMETGFIVMADPEGNEFCLD